MKLVKEIIIFLVMVAGIYVLFALNSSSSGKIDTTALMSGGIDRLSADIDAQWASLNDWNEELYRKQMTRIAQSHSAGLLDATARKTLYDRVNKQAYTKAVAAMEEEFGRASCNRLRLTDNYNGLMAVTTREPSVAMIPDVDRTLDTYALYNRIIAFNSINFGLTPKFSLESLDWSPKFESYASGVRSRRDALLSHKAYPRISHIIDVKKINDTERKLSEASARYYDSLASAITSSFTQASEAEDADLAALRLELQRLRSNVYGYYSPVLDTALSNLYYKLFV